METRKAYLKIYIINPNLMRRVIQCRECPRIHFLDKTSWTYCAIKICQYSVKHKKTAFVVKLLKFPTAVDLNQCFKHIIFKVFNSQVRSSF